MAIMTTHPLPAPSRALQGILCIEGAMLLLVVQDAAATQHLRWGLPGGVLNDVPRLAGLGLVGMVAYMLASRAYQVAQASLVALFDYTYLPFAALLAYVLWAEVPPTATLAGMLLIIGSGLYMGGREMCAARRGDVTPPTAKSTFTPGHLPPPQVPEEIRAP